MSKTYTLRFLDGSYHLASGPIAPLRLYIQLTCASSVSIPDQTKGLFWVRREYTIGTSVGLSLPALVRARLDGRPANLHTNTVLGLCANNSLRWGEVESTVWDAIFNFERLFVASRNAFQIVIIVGEDCERLGKDLGERFAHLDRHPATALPDGCGL